MNITDIHFDLDKKLYKKSADLLHSKNMLRMEQEEERVFNAEFFGKQEEIRTEIALDGDLDIEDVYCNCGRGAWCPHIVATLIGADLMTMTETKDIQSAVIAVQNRLVL
jgi:uncharacterized Zn finger protein